jgi:PAS domain S-box-containing protein
MRLSAHAKVASLRSAGGPAESERIVAKGGMPQLVRHYDWASTPLGPLHRWSAELVSVVNLILASPTPARLFWGPDLTLIYNDGYRSIPGRRHPHALGKPAREVFREAWSTIGPVFQTAYATGEPFVLDKRRLPVETGQGLRDLCLDCTYSPVYESGRVAGLLGLFHDVTGAVDTSRDLEARLSAIGNTTLECIAITTPEGILVDCNRAALEFAWVTRDDVVGMPFADAPWFAHTAGAKALIQQAIAAARSGERFRAELVLVRPDGEKFNFDSSLIPMRGTDGQVCFLVYEARDITEVRQTQSALLKSEKLAAVGRLAASIAHEINNPLESVMNLIYLARNARAGEADRYLDMADQEIRRVSIIANQTLRFHKQGSRPQAACAADLFSTVLGMYEGRLRNARIQIEKRFRADRPVMCFQGDVRQVLNNLVSNAIEAMPFGGRLLIRSRNGCDRETGRPGLVLTIADNGGGISPAVQAHIFDAFFTTKGTAGNGLGLWVSQQIAERHKGRLRVRSTQRPGRNGTTFTLFLPFEPAFK